MREDRREKTHVLGGELVGFLHQSVEVVRHLVCMLLFGEGCALNEVAQWHFIACMLGQRLFRASMGRE